MDARRFDDLAKTLAHAAPRRSVLRALLAVAAAALTRPRRGLAQAVTPPVPNLPFLVPLPTDERFTTYGLDFELTGPPARFRTLDGLTAMPDAWRTSLQADFRAAYGATITSPQSEDTDDPRRSISTLIVDLGTPTAAKNAHADYAAAVMTDPALSTVESDLATNRFVFGGCQGGCGRLSSSLPGGTDPNQEFALLGRRDRFLFDTRVRDYTDRDVTLAQVESVARLVDAKLRDAASATDIAAAGRTVARALVASDAAPRTNARGQQTTIGDLRESLLGATTLPLFAIGADPAPDSASQWLAVDGGEIVHLFGQSAAARTRSERSLENVAYALRSEQLSPLTFPYLGGYDLRLRCGQFVFLESDRAGDFLAATADRLEAGNRDRGLTTIAEGENEHRFGAEEPSANGPAFGLIVARTVPGGSFAGVVEVELAAVPRAPDQFPIDLGTLQTDLGPLLDEIARVLTLCLTTPDACPESPVLPPPGPPPSPPPTPTPAPPEPVCAAGTVHCFGFCVDLSADPFNCGDCGLTCAEGYVCADGGCACPPGLVDCGSCVDPSADPAHCGGCGLACLPEQYCATGVCLCPDGYPACGDLCCGAGQACDGGVCYDPDPCPGQTNCGDYCADLGSDPTNCGSCGTICETQACCSFACVDVEFDSANCGGCGIACPQDSFCYGGECAVG